MLAPVVDADGRLGLCDVLPGSAPTGSSWAQLAYDAGARTNRWEFRWDRIEPAPGKWNWTADDAAVASSLAAGISVEGIIDGTPKWAAAPGQPPGNGVPRGLGHPIDGRRNTWGRFVRALITHYAGRVKYWEVWNEPDLKYFWNGNANDYYRTLEVAYETVKAVDPAAQVLIAGMVVPDFAFLNAVLTIAAGTQGNVGPFDIAAWHAYGPAHDLYLNVQRMKAVLASHGFTSTPIWVTEDGFPASNPNGEPRQAAYVLQTIAYALAAGVDRVLIYRASDDVTPKTWGLVSSAGTPRAAYVAFQLAAQYFAGTAATVYDPAGQAERFTLYKPFRRLTLLWNRGLADSTIALPAAGSSATVIDWQGNVSTVAAIDGVLHLILPGASYDTHVDSSASVVGGPPVLVVEDNKPLAGGSQKAYVPPLSGVHRRLTLVNGSSQPVVAQVTGSDTPALREDLHLPPQSVREVDLDALAGPGYPTGYSLASNGALTAVATTASRSITPVRPSFSWYAADAPRPVVFTNPGLQVAHVAVRAYHGGRARWHTTMSLAPGTTVSWTPPSGSHRFAITASATGSPVIPGAEAGRYTALAQTSWYQLGQTPGRTILFNPASTAASITLHPIGGSSPSTQFTLPAHGIHTVLSGGPQGFALLATHPVILGGTSRVLPPPPSALAHGAVALDGPSTQVDLFDPAPQPSQVTLTIIKGTESVQQSVTINPGALSTIPVRHAGDPPAAVLYSSDHPVVAASR